jgi:hypothetical protein
MLREPLEFFSEVPAVDVPEPLRTAVRTALFFKVEIELKV